MKIVNAFVWVQIYLPNNVQWPRGTINNFLLFVSTVHACNTANRVMGSLIFLTFNWAELKSAKVYASLYSNNPSCHNHASSCWKYSKLSSRVCSSDYSHTTTGIRSKLTLDKGKCSETMDFQQIMINHKRPTLKNKANFNRAVTSEKRTKKFHFDDASLSWTTQCFWWVENLLHAIRSSIPSIF